MNQAKIKESNKSPLGDMVDSSSLTYKLSESLSLVINKSFGLNLNSEEVNFEHPKNSDFGDYSTNIALILAKNNKQVAPSQRDPDYFGTINNPVTLAEKLADDWKKHGLPIGIEKVTVVNGFLNLSVNIDYLINQMEDVLSDKSEKGILSGKKILLEHSSPNPQTTIMLGHLRNNFLGMACANLLKYNGAEVKLDCIVNDRGVHLCRSMFGYLMFANKDKGLTKDELINFKEITIEKLIEVIKGSDPGGGRTLGQWQERLVEWDANPNNWYIPEELGQKPDHANLIWYVLGSQAYGEIEGVEQQVHEMLKAWEGNVENTDTQKQIRLLWKMILSWSEEGYAQTYSRIGSHHDHYWYESDHWREGKDIVEEGLKRKIFKYGDTDPKSGKQPIVTDLANDGLTDTVVIKSDGTALYMTQDLALTRLKIQKFPSDLYIWDIGSEQTVYFRQLFAVIDKLGIADKNQLYHLSYALINFKGGAKMSTRKGDVVMADEVIDLLKDRAKQIVVDSNQKLRGELSDKQLDQMTEKVALGALKYSLLKYSRDTTMQFDIDESLSLTGNSGPYIQYTYARTKSVLGKAGASSTNLTNLSNLTNLLNEEELALLRTIRQYPEVLLQATKEFAPNLICNYLFDLAQKFNLFYDKHRIIPEQSAISNQQSAITTFRLGLTSAVGEIIKRGLGLLGIETVERM